MPVCEAGLQPYWPIFADTDREPRVLLGERLQLLADMLNRLGFCQAAELIGFLFVMRRSFLGGSRSEIHSSPVAVTLKGVSETLTARPSLRSVRYTQQGRYPPVPRRDRGAAPRRACRARPVLAGRGPGVVRVETAREPAALPFLLSKRPNS
jgi:hypothetical protein